MAFCASSFDAISTKPKPRDRRVSRSSMTVADSTVPISAKRSLSSSLVVCRERFPTKIFEDMKWLPFLNRVAMERLEL